MCACVYACMCLCMCTCMQTTQPGIADDCVCQASLTMWHSEMPSDSKHHLGVVQASSTRLFLEDVVHFDHLRPVRSCANRNLARKRAPKARTGTDGRPTLLGTLRSRVGKMAARKSESGRTPLCQNRPQSRRIWTKIGATGSRRGRAFPGLLGISKFGSAGLHMTAGNDVRPKPRSERPTMPNDPSRTSDKFVHTLTP